MRKLIRKEIRNIVEAFIPGSKAYMYNKYGIEGSELESIKDLLSHEDESFQKMGKDMFSSLADTDIIEVSYREIKIGLRNSNDYVYKKIQYSPEVIDHFIEKYEESNGHNVKLLIDLFETSKESREQSLKAIKDILNWGVIHMGRFGGYRSQEMNSIYSEVFPWDDKYK
tara:strand:- start:1121 stop:1627 length:507 start_codon:yes stop_codon:yes gene_type:complete